MQYGFNVDKFFDSDYFQKGIATFKSLIKKGIDQYVPQYVAQHGDEVDSSALTSMDSGTRVPVKDAAKRYVNAIKESLAYIDDKMCNNKFYKLINYDTYVEGEDEKVNEAADGKVFMTVDELLAKIKHLQPHLEANAGIVIADGSGRTYTVADIHLGDGIDNQVKAAMLEIIIDEVNMNEDNKAVVDKAKMTEAEAEEAAVKADEAELDKEIDEALKEIYK